MSDKFNIPTATATLVSKKGTWMSVKKWFNLAKLVVGVGLIIFIISTAAGQINGELAAYYWIGLGIIISLMMATIMASRTSGKKGILSILKQMASLITPAIFTLIPVIAMIVIFHQARSLLSRDASHLPKQFYTFHWITFIFLLIQIFLLNQFFTSEILARSKNISNPNRLAYVSGFIFSTIIALASVAEMYVIITKFITDG